MNERDSERGTFLKRVLGVVLVSSIAPSAISDGGAAGSCPGDRPLQLRAFVETKLHDESTEERRDGSEDFGDAAEIELRSDDDARPQTSYGFARAEFETSPDLLTAIARSYSCVSGRLQTGESTRSRSSATVQLTWRPESASLVPGTPLRIVVRTPITGSLTAWTGTVSPDRVLEASSEVEIRVDGFRTCFHRWKVRNDEGQHANPGTLSFIQDPDMGSVEVECEASGAAGFDCETIKRSFAPHRDGRVVMSAYAVSASIECSFDGCVDDCFSVDLFLTTTAVSEGANDNEEFAVADFSDTVSYSLEARDPETNEILTDVRFMPVTPPTFIRGEINGDTGRNVSDAVHLLLFLFAGGTATDCADAADVDDDGVLSISDAIRLLGFLFLGDPRPPEPATTCGVDMTDDALGCDRILCP